MVIGGALLYSSYWLSVQGGSVTSVSEQIWYTSAMIASGVVGVLMFVDLFTRGCCDAPSKDDHEDDDVDDDLDVI